MKYRIISKTKLGKDVFRIQRKGYLRFWFTLGERFQFHEYKKPVFEYSLLEDAIKEVENRKIMDEDNKKPWEVVWTSWWTGPYQPWTRIGKTSEKRTKKTKRNGR
jgi:hypothetical protein